MNMSSGNVCNVSFKSISNKIGETIHKKQLIGKGDVVAVGLSGGKDSFLLLEALVDRLRHFPFIVKIHAIHVHVNGIGYAADDEKLAGFCQTMNVPYHLVNTSADLNKDKKKSPCFVCSWARRKKLFDETRKLGCNKLALGHHADDALETMLMNMIWHGSISSMPYRLDMFNKRLTLIRPMLDLNENDVLSCTEKRKYPILHKECPYSQKTRRDEMKQLLASLETHNKHIRKNLFRSMNNICLEYLPNGINSCIHSETAVEIKAKPVNRVNPNYTQ